VSNDAGCVFCGREPTLTLSPQLHVCRSCAARVADLAADEVPPDVWAVNGARAAAVDASPPAPEAIDVERVFEDLKRGIAEQISADDAESHLNLAQAYCEMGLYRDARREAAVAARAPSRTETREAALRLLLDAPLLLAGGLERLRQRLRRALN
jgi:hypothetical protein